MAGAVRRELCGEKPLRVIAGTLKARQLKPPAWEGLRPTSDRLRETLFNVLASRVVGARVLDGYAGTGAVGIEALSRGAAHVTFVDQDRRAGMLVAENLAHCGVAGGYVIIRATVARTAETLRNGPDFVPFDLVLLDPPYVRPSGAQASGDGSSSARPSDATRSTATSSDRRPSTRTSSKRTSSKRTSSDRTSPDQTSSDQALPADVLADALVGIDGLLAAGGLTVLEHARRQPSPETAGRLVRTRLLTSGDSALSFYTLSSDALLSEPPSSETSSSETSSSETPSSEPPS